MKSIKLTRVHNKDNGNFICVREDFEGGISLVYREDKGYIYAKPYKTNGSKFFTEEEQKEISEYLESKGFPHIHYDSFYYKNECVSRYQLYKFKDLDRTFGDITDLVWDRKNVVEVEIFLENDCIYDDNDLIDIYDYHIVKNLCNYLCEDCDYKDASIKYNNLTEIMIKCNDLNRFSASISTDTWNNFCKSYGYEKYEVSNSYEVNLYVDFKENDKIREIHTLLRDNAFKEIGMKGIEFSTAKDGTEYMDMMKSEKGIER